MPQQQRCCLSNVHFHWMKKCNIHLHWMKDNVHGSYDQDEITFFLFTLQTPDFTAQHGRMYVYMYVCIYRWMHVCMYACMSTYIHECIDVCTHCKVFLSVKTFITMLLEDIVTKQIYVKQVMMASMLNYDLKTDFLLELGEPWKVFE